MIYTFYSFKGGVGRSMALASVAYLLATRGLRVLTIDFDLEAPGLERYFFEAEGATGAKARPGLIDLLLAYKRALSNEEEFREGEFRQWQRFVQSAVPSVTGGGRVDLLSAGQREPQDRYGSYANAVRSFDWLDFFHHWKGERFFDWLRGEFVGDARGAGGAYDAVLVDSRTGITEMGGVCAYQLADVAVMLCAANEQNLDGTLRVARDFRSDATLALRRGRPLELLVIPARLEAHNERRQEFLAKFHKTFDRASYLPKQLYELDLDYERLALPYDPAFAIIEQIVGERATERGVAAAAASTFERLADALTLLAWVPGRLHDGQAAARRRILGQGDSLPTPRTQLADPTKSAADFDFFLDEAFGSSASMPSLAQGLREAGLRVGTLEVDAPMRSEVMASARPILHASRALMVMFHSAEVSPWTSALIDEARRLQRPIFPLVVASSPESPGWRALRAASLGHVAAVQLDERNPASWLPAVLGAWKQWHAADEPAVEPAADVKPYPGTRSFSEADAGFFFGRGAEVDALTTLVDNADLTLLTGAAGVGKTSLLRAGLLPALRKRAEAEPQRACRVLYLDLADDADKQHMLATWLEDTGNEPGLVAIDSVDSFPHRGDAPAVDARIEAVARLLDMLPPRMRALLALRNVLDAATRSRAVERWLSRRGDRRTARFELPAMTADALAQAVEKPAARLGHVVDPGLTALLISQAGPGRGAVAELARVLPVLWQGRRRGWLTAAPLEAQGGTAGLFARAFSAFAASLTEPERDAVRALVRSLSRLEATMRWSAGPAEWAWLSTIPAVATVDAVALRDRLAASHFIDLCPVQAEGAARQDDLRHPLPAGEVMVALAHELPSLYGTEHATPFDAGFVLWRQQFASFVQGWVRAGRSANALLPEQPLIEAELEASRHAGLLSEPERVLIEQSRERFRRIQQAEADRLQAQQQQVEQVRLQQRERRLYFFMTWILLALLVLVGWAAYQAILRRDQAEAAEVRARGAEKAALSEKDAALRASQRADEQARIAEERLQRMKTIIEQVPDERLRTRLTAEHIPGATRSLTPTQQQQRDAKARMLAGNDPAVSGTDRPIGAKLWPLGSTLRVRFIGGSTRQHAVAKAAAQEWSRYANLHFKFVDRGDAEVRISFKPTEGSWSLVGIDALGVSMAEPTMNLGFPELGVVLHEFGHVLGLIHESQNPNAHLPWDREAVFREMTGAPNYWPRAQVERSILDTEPISGYRAFDPDSIMMYAFSGTLFTDGVARGGKQVLSASDKAFAAKLYPPR